jgi:hypothetical protein
LNTEVSEQSALIYHHTDHGGATGILSSATFRFSGIEYLNDSAERTHALSYISDCITREEEKYESNENMLSLLKHMRSENRLLPIRYFVGCFTQSINELSQWRGYSRTVPSYAIAFRRDALVNATREIMKDDGLGIVWADSVTYGGPTRKAPLVDDFIQGRISSMLHYIESADGCERERTHPGHFRSHAQNVGDALSLHFLQKHEPAFLKHEAFHAEEEFRIAIQYNSPSNGKSVKLGVTAGAATMKPYIELTYSKEVMRSLIEQMIVGPTPEEKLACRALEQYRTSLGYDFAVQYCKLPFRPGW